MTYHTCYDQYILTVEFYVWVQTSPEAGHLIAHYTIGPKWVVLRPCPTQKSRPKGFRPDSTVIPSMRKREVGLRVGRLVRRCRYLHDLIIKLAGACSAGDLMITSRRGHNLLELDVHLESF